ncbi:nucleotidyltransferase family protein [Dyadobacter arcticus]|uniref:Nucleotidyltransferase family protein n=1 Tax=Dyadobacter arcticus TaxID=1078754 RepID=A0ABX0UK94_9BACT|nr:nucleotidyltransferase family protein [Dyadobacter arcticus]NIJ52005.1 hypothetical protein [Dyadobacter arcticus]
MLNLKVSPELALLIQAALENQRATQSPPQLENLNWDRVTSLSRYHQIRPLLFDYIEGADLSHVPKPHFQLLKNFTLGQAVTNMSFLKVSIDLYKQLMDRGVNVFLMKGALWAWMLYDKPGSREFGDVDYFVDKKDITKSLSILAGCGFEPDPYRKHLMEESNISQQYLETDYQLPMLPTSESSLRSLEIQWNSSYPRYCYDFTWAELSKGMLEFKIANTHIKVPGMENQLLMMLIHHGGVEQWDKLKYVADFTRLLLKYGHSLDWDYISDVTKAKGFHRLLLESLGMVKALTDSDYFVNIRDSRNQHYPSNSFLKAITDHWENTRELPETKTWRIFRYNMIYRDGWKFKFLIAFAHLNYFAHWKLILNKFFWYRRNR